MAKSIRLFFPLKGVDKNWAVSEQPPLTTPDSQNVRPYDVIKERARGGPRPGFRKLFSQQIGSAAARIDALCQVAVGYISAGAVNLVAPEPDPMTFSGDFFEDGCYELGTIAITQTDKTVTLTSGIWPSWAATNGILVYDGVEYPIASRTSDLEIELVSVWAIASITGASYQLWPDGEPVAIDTVSITMVATEAEDPDDVEYYFANVTDPTHDSGWQDSPVFIDLGLTASTAYTYKVKARDKSVNKNETAYSTEKTATTLAVPADATPPTYTPTVNGIWETVPYSYLSGGFYYHRMVAVEMTDAATPPVEYLFKRTTSPSANSGWIKRATEAGTKEYKFGPFLTANHAAYRVDVRDGAGNMISSSTWHTLYGLIT